MKYVLPALIGLSTCLLAAPPGKTCPNPVPNVLKASMPTRSPAMGNSITSPNVDLILTYDANTSAWYGNAKWPDGKNLKVKLWNPDKTSGFLVELDWEGIKREYPADAGFTCQPFYLGVAGVITIKE